MHGKFISNLCFPPSPVPHSPSQKQARIHILAKEKEWKAALAEAIDPAVLPPEYGGNGSSFEDLPFLPDVHRALELDSAPLPAAAAVTASGLPEETAVPEAPRGGISAGESISTLVEWFSFRNRDCAGADSGAGGGGGGNSHFVARGGGFAGGDSGSGCGGGGSRSDRAGAGGSDACCKVGNGYGEVERERSSGGKAKASPQEKTAQVEADVAREGEDNYGESGSNTHNARDRPFPREESEEALEPTDQSCASRIVGGGKEDEAGDLQWILGVIPGARLAVAVAGNATSLTLNATLGAVGFAAGVAEAVVPPQMWADAVQAFETSQFMGRWALGV